MTTFDTLKRMDQIIASGLDHAGELDHATIGGKTVDGYFIAAFAEQGEGEDAVGGLMQTFDCRAEDLPDLLPDDLLTVEGYGQFRYIRTQRVGNGRAILLLGSLL